LLVGNTSIEERHSIAGWVRDALSKSKASSNSLHYQVLLVNLQKQIEKKAH